jgi:protein involved in polysaccharide export with SLBB domain
MNFLSKLTLFSCAAVFAGTVLSGCGSSEHSEEPQLSDNPSAPAVAGTGSQSGAGMSAGATNGAASITNSGTDDVDSLQNRAARFQAGETVNIGTSTGSEAVAGPIPSSPQSYLISDDGTISLPYVGSVMAEGKTPGELQKIITQAYVPNYYVNLAVTVTAMNRVYYVGGEVGHPGPEEYLGQTTVTRAIQSAGDFTMFASHTVWLTRSDGTRIQVNVDKALQDSASDPPVFPGDQIQVPRRRL